MRTSLLWPYFTFRAAQIRRGEKKDTGTMCQKLFMYSNLSWKIVESGLSSPPPPTAPVGVYLNIFLALYDGVHPVLFLLFILRRYQVCAFV